MVIGGATTIATGLFWGAVYLGRLTARLERVEGRVGAHETQIADHDRMIRTLSLKP